MKVINRSQTGAVSWIIWESNPVNYLREGISWHKEELEGPQYGLGMAVE